MDKIIEVNFEKEEYFKFRIRGLKQWDQGQKLQISGLDISDEIVEVHFSLQEAGGTAKRRLGIVTDGIIHVDIPTFILEGPEWSNDYSAWAWIYLSDKESAKTARKIEFTIEVRPKPDEYVTPEELSFLQQLENAIKNKITTPTSAKIGQLLRVKKTDENGKPTEFDTVDRAEGGANITVDEELSKKSTNPVQNAVVTKEINTLKDTGKALEDKLLQFAIKQTTEKATSHNITDSANYRMLDFGMDGISNKVGGDVGGNLLVYPYKNVTTGVRAGVNVTVHDDGRITLDGETNGMLDFFFEEIPVEENESYIFDFGILLDYSPWFEVRGGYTSDGNHPQQGEIFTTNLDSRKSIDILMLIEPGRIFNNLTLYPRLNKGTELKPWVPYGVSDIKPQIINAGTLNEETGRYEFGISLSDDKNTKLQEITLTSPVSISKWDKLVKRDSVYGWSIWSVLIESYNGEDVTDEYISTTNDLSIGSSVQYKATEEVMFIPLLQEEQEMLKNMETYYGKTEISNDQNCPMWLEYVADTKLYVDNQILEMKKAII